MSVLGQLARRLLRKVGEIPPNLDPFADLQRLLGSKPVETVLDVGGCFGDYSLRFAELWPEATVHAFEPNPESYGRLTQRVKDVPAIRPVNLGAWKETGPQTFHLNSWAGACSLKDRPRSGPAYHSPEAVHVDTTEVNLIRLDEWAAREDVREVDLLKLDIQGSELDALIGAEELLASVRCILTEVHFYPNYEGAPLLAEVWNHLRERGFSLYQLYSSWGGDDGQLVQGDAIFVSDEVRDEQLQTNGAGFRSVRFHT
jgi:FkbM family methyltransferase